MPLIQVALSISSTTVVSLLISITVEKRLGLDGACLLVGLTNEASLSLGGRCSFRNRTASDVLRGSVHTSYSVVQQPLNGVPFQDVEALPE